MGAELTIGVVARRVGIRPSAVRFYERQGLIASERLANGYRCYDRDAVKVLGFISRANNPVAATAVALGLLVITWMTLSTRIASWPEHLQSHFHSFLIPVFGTLTILFTGLVLQSVFKSRKSIGK